MNVDDVFNTPLQWHCPKCGVVVGWTYDDMIEYGFPTCTGASDGSGWVCGADMLYDEKLYAPDDEDE